MHILHRPYPAYALEAALTDPVCDADGPIAVDDPEDELVGADGDELAVVEVDGFSNAAAIRDLQSAIR